MIASSSPARLVTEALLEAIRLEKAGRYDDARVLCRNILDRQPNQVDALHIHGLADVKAGDVESAIKHLQRAVKLKPDLAAAHVNLALAWQKAGRWTKRAEALKAALAQMPGSAAIAGDIGHCYRQVDRLSEAVAWYEKALALDQGLASARVALGVAQMHLGRLDVAEAAYDRVLAAEPGNVEACANLAILRDIQDRRDEVLALLEGCLARNPDNADIHVHRALALLARGRLAEGWKAYEWRFRRASAKTMHNRFALPYWQGEALSGRRLLIWTEQGPGDELLLGTMIGDVLAAGASCVLVCSERMVPLFRRSFPTAEVATAEQAAGVVKDRRPDWQASLSHLGLYLRPALDSFKNAKAYLKADQCRTEELRNKYRAQAGGRPLVGLAWHSRNADASGYKSVSLKDFAPLLADPRFQFVSLQYGDVDMDLAAVRKIAAHPILHDRTVDALRDLDMFAAQVGAMDRVISVSNTTVHFAGALGVPCWTLVPASYGRIWYWFLDRVDSQWYPSLRLCRQMRGESWADAITRMAAQVLTGNSP